jgi:anti-sigma B factor antagonist
MDELEGEQTTNLEAAEVSVDQWQEESGAMVVRISGEVDMSNADVLRETIDPIAASDVHHLIFDLGGLEFIDSSGLTVLLAAAQKVPQVQLRDPSPIVRRIVEVTGLGEVLPTEP